jgi:pyrophosphatase PpaX
MPQFNTFLFDLDGTLIDSLELILRSYRHTLVVHRGVAPADAVWLAGIGTPLRTQLAPYAEDADDLEQMVATYRDYNFAHHDALVRPFPGIRSAVSALKHNGTLLGIVTSKGRTGTLKGLHTCNLEDLFDTIVAADDVDRHKPDPAPVLRALELLDRDANAAVFIGDSPFDMAAGRDAGVHTAAALWGPFGREVLEPYAPDYWLKGPADITTIRL